MNNRHRFRAKWHDYNNGMYFITVSTLNKKHTLGKIVDGEMMLSELGRELDKWIRHYVGHNQNDVINYTIMPNHFHLIVDIRENDSNQVVNNLNKNDLHHNSRLARFVGCLKGGVKRYATRNDLNFDWQSRYYDHIIRNGESFKKIMEYIDSNVECWADDCYNK